MCVFSSLVIFFFLNLGGREGDNRYLTNTHGVEPNLYFYEARYEYTTWNNCALPCVILWKLWVYIVLKRKDLLIFRDEDSEQCDYRLHSQG
jgi:hypothetical protein